MSWLISPPEETSWRMTRPEVADLLRRLWPSVEVTPADPRTKMAMFWEVTRDADDWVSGSLEDIGQCLYVKGSSEEIARLAFHVKQEFAPDQDLLLFDEAYSEVIPLEDKSEQDILRSLNGDP